MAWWERQESQGRCYEEPAESDVEVGRALTFTPQPESRLACLYEREQLDFGDVRTFYTEVSQQDQIRRA